LKVTARLDGQREVMKKFSHLAKRGARNAVAKSVRAGADPQVKETRRNAPRETGLLKRRTTKKIKRYGQGRYVLAVIGAKRGKDPVTGRNPAWYGHLVEGGAKPHTIPKSGKTRKRLKFDGGGAVIVRARVNHPGMQGTRFMERAFQSKKQESLTRFKSKFTSEVLIEARKQGV